jgi:plastocyanin
VATLEILINGDSSGQPPVDPQYARVYVGSIVRWVNKDTVARSVKADSGQFVSPPIPPGGSYDYKATTTGLFDYADDTRPYVKAVLEVLAT